MVWQYLSDKPSEKTQAILEVLLGDDAGSRKSFDNGFGLDQLQIDILSKSLHCESSGKKYLHTEMSTEFVFLFMNHLKLCFSFPLLIICWNPMLCKSHGSKTIKSWGKNRQLASQP